MYPFERIYARLRNNPFFVKGTLSSNTFTSWNFIFTIVSFSLVIWKFTSGYEGILDIALWDEAYYLGSADSYQKSHQLPGANWAPLYTLLYSGLSIGVVNKIDLYVVVQLLSLIGLPLSVGVLVYKKRIPFHFVLIGFYFILSTFMNFTIVPKPMHFAMVILFISWMVSIHQENEFNLPVFSVGVALASLFRPEIFLAFILIIGYGVIHFVWKGNPSWKNTKWKFFPVLCILGIFYFFGIPMFNGDNRQMMAFGQHFAIHWVEEHHSALNPQLNWELILNNEFGNPKNLVDVIMHNPASLGRHMALNIKKFIFDIRFFFYHANLFFPNDKIQYEGSIFLIVFLLSIFIYIKRIITYISNHVVETCCLAILLVPGIISCILIYPRQHYLLSVCMVSFVLLFVALCSDRKELPFIFKCLLVVCLVYFISPISSSFPRSLQNLALVEEFNKKIENKNVGSTLESGAGWRFYLPDYHWKTVEEISNTEKDIHQIIEMEKITSIVVDYYFNQQPLVANNKNWYNWLEQEYMADGFQKVTVGTNFVYFKSLPQ